MKQILISEMLNDKLIIISSHNLRDLDDFCSNILIEQIKDVAEDQLKGVYENAAEFSLVVEGCVLPLKKSLEVFALFVEAQKCRVDYMELNKDQYYAKPESYYVNDDIKIHTKNHVIIFKVTNEISKELQKHIVN